MAARVRNEAVRPAEKTTYPKRALFNGAVALLGIAATVYTIHNGLVFHPTAAFDTTNDGVFSTGFPDIHRMVLINGNTADTVFESAKQAGLDQAMTVSAASIAGLTGFKAITNGIEMTDKTRSKLNFVPNAILLAGGIGLAAHSLLDGSDFNEKAAFDLTHDGVFPTQTPGISDMILIHGNTADTVFESARYVGFDQGLGLGGTFAVLSWGMEPVLSGSKSSAK